MIIGWGNNREGQLNIPDGLNNVISIGAGFNYSLAIKKLGSMQL
jgi:hypothetical protein